MNCWMMPCNVKIDVPFDLMLLVVLNVACLKANGALLLFRERTKEQNWRWFGLFSAEWLVEYRTPKDEVKSVVRSSAPQQFSVAFQFGHPSEKEDHCSGDTKKAGLDSPLLIREVRSGGFNSRKFDELMNNETGGSASLGDRFSAGLEPVRQPPYETLTPIALPS
nr:hypothetical protein Iba_chr03cCG9280 [Ipomoea batatas]